MCKPTPKAFDKQEFYVEMLEQRQDEITYWERRVTHLQKMLTLTKWEIDNLRLQITETKGSIAKLKALIEKGE